MTERRTPLTPIFDNDIRRGTAAVVTTGGVEPATGFTGTPGVTPGITDLQNAVDLDTDADYAYCVRSSGGGRLVIVDITDPENPAYVSTLSHADLAGAVNVIVLGDVCFVLCGAGGNCVTSVDVTNRAAPSIIQKFVPNTTNAIGNAIAGFTYTGGHVFTRCSNDLNPAGSATSLMSINVSNPAAMSQAAVIGVSCVAHDMVVLGSRLYIAGTTSDDIHIVNISSPGAPTYVGAAGITQSITGNPHQQLAGNGTTLYWPVDTTTGTSTGPLKQINVLTPDAPVEDASVAVTSGGTWPVAASTNAVFVAEPGGLIESRARGTLAVNNSVDPNDGDFWDGTQATAIDKVPGRLLVVALYGGAAGLLACLQINSE